MFGRVAICGAAAVMLLPLLLTPAPSSAKGFAAGSVHHGGGFRAHVNRHARHHHHRHHRNNRNGYAYWPAGFDYPQEVLMPLYVGPRCTPSVETAIVPSESGGQREIRITRC